MEQRLLHTAAPSPQSSGGFLHCVCTAAGSSWNWSLGKYQIETPLWILMASSKLGLSAFLIIVQKLAPKSSLVRCLQTCLLLVQGIWVFQASAAHTFNCFITWLFASVWGKSSAAKSVDGTDDWDGTSSLLKIHWEANVNMLPFPLVWVTAVLQTPHCLWACFGEALGGSAVDNLIKSQNKTITPVLRILHSLWLQLNFMFVFPELKLGWSCAFTAFAQRS